MSVLVLGVFLTLLAIGLNVVLIPKYGLDGAAMATFIAVSCYNSLKIYYVKRKFAMTPLSADTFKGLGVLLVFCATFYYWDFSFHPIINIGMKSVLLGITYVFVIYKLKISSDINGVFDKVLKRFGK